ncbi:MAG: hemolysin family protein [bacterium]|nr:hemolysin family protein [bacterium]
MFTAFQILLFLLLLCFSAFFSASETAIFSLSSLTRKKIAEESRRFSILNEPHTLLPTILFGNTLVNITIPYLAAIAIVRFVGTLSPQDMTIITLCIAFIILCFGEVAPKFVSARFGEIVTRKGISTLLLFKKIFTPFIFLITFGMDRFWKRDEANLTLYELKVMLNLAKEEGYVTEKEKRFAERVLSLKEITAEDIMTPRKNIQALDESTPLQAIITGHLHSRIPLYRDNIDNITGVLYLKDVLPYLYFRRPGNILVKRLKRNAMFIPLSMRLSELLENFQKKRTHIAICVDEYGGVDGLVTLDDILERIV